MAEMWSMMKRTSEFLSLSCFTGVMGGIYALSEAYIGYKLLYFDPDEIVTAPHKEIEQGLRQAGRNRAAAEPATFVTGNPFSTWLMEIRRHDNNPASARPQLRARRGLDVFEQRLRAARR